MPALREYAVTKLATVTGINAKTVATTELFPVPANKTLIVDHVVIRCTAFTVGSKAVQAVASFGGNSATYDDYLNSVTYTIAAANVYIQDLVLDAATVTYAAGVSFRISIETGSDATTETWAVDLFGYLV
jgi:CO/xanthine dehydrogenase FAD-binding subunit